MLRKHSTTSNIEQASEEAAKIEFVTKAEMAHINESERVSIKESRDVAIQLSETANEDCTSNMKTLYDAAVLQSS